MTAIINPALPASPPTSGISRYAHQIGQEPRCARTSTGTGQGFQEFSVPQLKDGAMPAGAPSTTIAARWHEPPHVVRSGRIE